MNGRQHREFIERERARLMEQARGDVGIALDIAIAERVLVGNLVSAGIARLPPVLQPRPPRAQIPAIDIPTGADATNPNA